VNGEKTGKFMRRKQPPVEGERRRPLARQSELSSDDANEKKPIREHTGGGVPGNELRRKEEVGERKISTAANGGEEGDPLIPRGQPGRLDKGKPIQTAERKRLGLKGKGAKERKGAPALQEKTCRRSKTKRKEKGGREQL